MVSFDFLLDSPSVPGLHCSCEDRQHEKHLVFQSNPLDLNVHLFLPLCVQVLLPVSTQKHSHPLDCLLWLLTVISQRHTGRYNAFVLPYGCLCGIPDCVSFSGSVDQTAHDATARGLSLATHQADVFGSTNAFGNHFLVRCAAHFLCHTLQHSQ